MIYAGKIERIDDDGTLAVVFSPEVIAKLGWKVGDDLKWERGPGKSWIIRKAIETK